jgi:hypothetical protein
MAPVSRLAGADASTMQNQSALIIKAHWHASGWLRQSVCFGDAWDDTPLREKLRSQIQLRLTQGDVMLVFDPSAFVNSGRQSVSVGR